MTLQEFKLYALAKKQIEYHSFNPRALFQCTDLANDYILKVWRLTGIIGTNAKDFPERLSLGMEFIKNTAGYLPEAGELAVWSGRVGGGAGHISVVLKKGLQTSFQSLDQNWSKPLFITQEKHSYTNVRGFLRKKESMPVTDPLKECLSQHSKLVTEATKKDKTIEGLEIDVLNKETEIKGLKASLEETSDQNTTLGKQVSAYKGEVTKKENEIIELNKKLTEKPSGFLVGKRKMLVGILTPIVVAVVKIISTKLGVEIDAQEMLYLILAGLAYIGVEGAKDLTVAVKSLENTDISTK